MDATTQHIKNLIQAAREELEEASHMSTGLLADTIDSANNYLIQVLDVLAADSSLQELDFD